MSTFKLSPQQEAVIAFILNERGSLELRARAGCGKTSTIMEVVRVIVENRLGDAAIMAYNKSIAEEIKGRLERAGYDWRLAQAGTVHSFGFSAWRKVAPNVRVDGNKVAAIVENLFMETNDPVFDECRGAVIRLVGYAKQRALGHLVPVENLQEWQAIWDHFDLDDDVTESWLPALVIDAAQQVYRISLKQCREVVDFDDMILAPLVFKARFWPKRFVLLDESQDTNPARRALAMAMLTPGVGRMLFVGDPAQAIYGFTGADSNSMDQLREATNARILPLTVTYRCPKRIVAEAQRLVPDITAHESAPEGVIRECTYEDMLDKETLTATDVILCRNTAPLIQTAYSLLSRGTACRVEGREIGEGLIKLARRWKVVNITALLVRLEDYEARQTAKLMSKGQEAKVEALQDHVECLRLIAARCQQNNQHTVQELITEITRMFGNTPEGEQPRILTLSTIHRSKGREWPRVFLLGRREFMPSPYARQAWQQQQESNLEYVAITRAQQELVDVTAPPRQRRQGPAAKK